MIYKCICFLSDLFYTESILVEHLWIGIKTLFTARPQGRKPQMGPGLKHGCSYINDQYIPERFEFHTRFPASAEQKRYCMHDKKIIFRCP